MASTITIASDAQAPERQHVEIKRHDVPERGKPQEIAVVGLDLHLAKAVDAGQEWQEEPGLLPRGRIPARQIRSKGRNV